MKNFRYKAHVFLISKTYFLLNIFLSFLCKYLKNLFSLKCSKICKNTSKKCPCYKNEGKTEKNIKSNTNTPQPINIINNENKKIENKEIFKIITRNSKKESIQIINNNNNNNKIFDLNIKKSDTYFSPEDIIIINQI